MSWHFSRALVGEYLEPRSLDGELSALWKSIPFARDDLCSDKMKGTCHRTPFGMMYVPLTDVSGLELLTLFLEDFHALTSVQPGKKPGLLESKAAYGWRWPESFAKYDHDLHGWRTRQHSFIEGLDEFCQTWPKWGLMLDGECLDLEVWAPITNEKGAGSWPTPCHGSSRWGGTFQEVGGSKNKLRNTPTGRLYVNPDFWESLMGWPIGWTGTAPLEMDKIHEWQRLLGNC